MTAKSTGMTCPFCGHKDLEKIFVGSGYPSRWWRPGNFFQQVVPIGGKVDSYRCGKCRYIMMFARD